MERLTFVKIRLFSIKIALSVSVTIEMNMMSMSVTLRSSDKYYYPGFTGRLEKKQRRQVLLFKLFTGNYNSEFSK